MATITVEKCYDPEPPKPKTRGYGLSASPEQRMHDNWTGRELARSLAAKAEADRKEACVAPKKRVKAPPSRSPLASITVELAVWSGGALAAFVRDFSPYNIELTVDVEGGQDCPLLMLTVWSDLSMLSDLLADMEGAVKGPASYRIKIVTMRIDAGQVVR